MSELEVSPAKRARQVDARVREIGEFVKTSFVEMGYLLIEAEQKQLHQFLCDSNGKTYHSHDAWISSALPFCRATAYQAKRVVRELADVPAEKLKQIPRASLEMLRLLPAKERKNGWIERAVTLEPQQFASVMRDEIPDLHIEQKIRWSLSLDFSAHAKINEAVAKFQMEEGGSKEQAVESWAANYLEERND